MNNFFSFNRIFCTLLFCFIFCGIMPAKIVHAEAVQSFQSVELTATFGLLDDISGFLNTIVEGAKMIFNLVIELFDFLPRLIRLVLPFLPEFFCRAIGYFIYFLLIKSLISIIRG